MTYTLKITRAELDKELKLRDPSLHNIDSTTYGERRDRALRRALADLQAKYKQAGEPDVLADTFNEVSPPSTGTAVANTSVGDLYKITLITGAEKIYGDYIWVTSGTQLKQAVRRTPDEIILSGTDATLLAFFEVDGKIQLYIKDAEITTIPATVHYTYYKGLTPPAGDSDVVPVIPDDIDTVITSTLEYMQL